MYVKCGVAVAVNVDVSGMLMVRDQRFRRTCCLHLHGVRLWTSCRVAPHRGLLQESTIFQKSRRHLKILGVRRVTRIRFHFEGPTKIRRHRTKFSSAGDMMPGICAPCYVGFEFLRAVNARNLDSACFPKCCYLLPQIQDVTFQKTVVFREVDTYRI